MKSSSGSSAANRTATPLLSFAANEMRRCWYTDAGCFSTALSTGAATHMVIKKKTKLRTDFIAPLSAVAAAHAKRMHRLSHTLSKARLEKTSKIARIQAGPIEITSELTYP